MELTESVCQLMLGMVSLLLPLCFFVPCSCFTYGSHACPVVRGGGRGEEKGRVGGSNVFWGLSVSLQLDKASGTPIPELFPELNPCIVVAMMMSASVITQTACAHTQSLADS